MIELLEGLLYRKHSHLSRDEVLEMFHLTPLHKTRAWREMHDAALNEGKELAKLDVARNCLSRGMSIKETAELTGLTLALVRRVAKENGKKK